VLARRGFSPDLVEVARRHFNGLFEPGEMFSNLMKLGTAYNPHTSWLQIPHMLFYGLQTKLQDEALIYGGTTLLNG